MKASHHCAHLPELCQYNLNQQKMNNLKTKPGVGYYCLAFVWALACFVFFQFWYHYHFFYQEQNQLFLWSYDYLETYLDKPGWLACMAGDFLTQFYYYLYAGPIILTLVLLFLGHNVRCALQVTGIKGRVWPCLIAFVVMTIEALLSLHYDYRLSSIFAIAGGANVFRASTNTLTATRLLVKRMEKKLGGDELEDHTLPHWISAISILVTVPVCHWLFGSGVWTYALLVIIGCLIHIEQGRNYLRLGVLVATMFLLMLTKRIYFVDFKQLYTCPEFGKFVKPEFELEKTFSVDYEYYFGNYNKVISIMEKEENPNQYMKFFYNLVIAQNKSLSDNLLRYPDNNLGTFETVGPGTQPMTIKTIGELYWLLGDMTFAERATILANVSSPFSRNIRNVKRLAEINLVKGDVNAAKKYLRILQKTFVWKRWSNRIFAALGRHATQEERATIQPYLDKRPFINTQDTIRTNDNCYTIMKELVESNPANNIAINYMLCSDLLLKDMDTFKHDYDAYYLKQKHVLYDPLYQEALMIYLAGTKASPTEWAKYIKRTDILQQFQQYNKQRGSVAFSGTYWYYFDKMPTPKIQK